MYRIERSWILLARACAVGLAAFTLMFLSGPLWDPALGWQLSWSSSALAAALATGCARVGFQSERYAVELSPEGIRRLADGGWLPWTRLARLVDRPLLQRVDLLDAADHRFASLDYQLSGFAEALATAQAACAQTSSTGHRFVRSAWGGVTGAALAAGLAILVSGLWLWRSGGEVHVLLLGGVALAAVGLDARSEVASVVLSHDGITVRRGLRTRTLAWAALAGVELGLRFVANGGQRLDVFVLEADGTGHAIRPAGADPFALHARIRDALRQR